MGIIKLQDQLYLEASKYFERVLNIFPGHVDANYNLVISYHQLGRFHEAIRHCKEAIR